MTRPPNPELIKQIQEVVAETIRRSGSEGITLRGIAGQLGVTPTTIYYYFQNKEDLLDQIKIHVIHEMEEAVLAAINPGDTCRKQLEDLLRSFVRWSIEHPRLLELVFEKLPPKLALEGGDYLGTYYRSQLKVIELLEAGIAAGEFAPRNCRLDATVLLGMVYGVLKLHLEKRTLPEFWEDSQSLTERVVDLTFTILRT